MHKQVIYHLLEIPGEPDSLRKLEHLQAEGRLVQWLSQDQKNTDTTRMAQYQQQLEQAFTQAIALRQQGAGQEQALLTLVNQAEQVSSQWRQELSQLKIA